MMVNQARYTVVLLALLTVITAALVHIDPPRGDSFTGLCIYSTDGFSLLSNGTHRVAVGKSLEVGETYRVFGRLRRTNRGLWMDVRSVEPAKPDFPLESVEGAYWIDWNPVLLTPSRIRLAREINASKGEVVLIRGLESGGKFYPLYVERRGFLETPKEGFPFAVRGVVLSTTGKYAVVWNGSEEFKVLRFRGVELHPGMRVKVVGVVRIRDSIYIYPASGKDFEIIGYPKPVPLSNSSTGDFVDAECYVTGKGKRSLKLDCTELRLYGFKAKVGDLVHVLGLRRKSSILCINCSVVKPREKLPNSICKPVPNRPLKISGRVEWVKTYRNGFGIANVTFGKCWILLKLPKSLRVAVKPGEWITAFGFFTEYRGMPAFHVESREDLCSGKW